MGRMGLIWLMKTMEEGFILGFQIEDGSHDSLMIFHLLFLIIPYFFSVANVERLLYIRYVLLYFEKVSSLTKRQEWDCSCWEDDTDDLADILHCKVGCLPMNYLACHWDHHSKWEEFGILPKENMQSYQDGRSLKYPRAEGWLL